MRRLLVAAAAALLVPAAVLALPISFPENPGGGGGVTAPGSTYGIPSRVGLQDAITYYHWQTVPGTTVGATSWVVKNSITNAYSYRVDGPWLSMVPIGATPGVQSLCYERAVGAAGSEIGTGQSAVTDRRRIIFGMQYDPNDPAGSATNGMWSFMFGDTTCLVRQKIPRGFGVCLLSTGRAFGGIAPGILHGFVGNGSDTTYVPLTAAADAMDAHNDYKIFIDAHAGGVDFYVNDVYRATITSPARAYTNAVGFTPGCAVWNESWDSDDISVSIGFLTVQREWSP